MSHRDRQIFLRATTEFRRRTVRARPGDYDAVGIFNHEALHLATDQDMQGRALTHTLDALQFAAGFWHERPGVNHLAPFTRLHHRRSRVITRLGTLGLVFLEPLF